MNPDIVLITKA